MSSSSEFRILLVEDHEQTLRAISEQLQKAQTTLACEIKSCLNAEQAEAQLAESQKQGLPFHMAIIDAGLTNAVGCTKGIDLAVKINRLTKQMTPILLITGNYTREIQDKAWEQNLFDIALKCDSMETKKGLLEKETRRHSETTQMAICLRTS
jgi:CheY-like chemotaxis protein